MKKITLLAAALFFGFQAANASAIINSDHYKTGISIYDAEPISFTERGIEFFVFADGQFDFNTVQSAGEDYYRSRNRAKNRTYGAPANSYNAGVKIEHDAQGRIRRVGNVFINYDRNDRIKRIGSVYMSYNRYALSQVGGLKIIYNRRGEITGYAGTVNGRNYTTHYSNGGYSNDYYNDDNTSPAQNDSDYYYYRKDGTKAKVEDKNTSEKED